MKSTIIFISCVLNAIALPILSTQFTSLELSQIEREELLKRSAKKDQPNPLPVPVSAPAPVPSTTPTPQSPQRPLTGIALVNTIISGVANVPAIGSSINILSNTLTSVEANIASVARLQTSQNTVNVKGNCASVVVVFARGTTEPGNVGALAGPPFFDALKTAVGSVSVQGVDYPASVQGFLAGGDATGSSTMADIVKRTLDDCKDSAVVMAGYSQGGQLVHSAAAQLNKLAMQKVSSIVIFGDPLNGTPVDGAEKGRTLVICNNTDNICQGGDLILPSHLTYANNAAQAAAFVANNARTRR